MPRKVTLLYQVAAARSPFSLSIGVQIGLDKQIQAGTRPHVFRSTTWNTNRLHLLSISIRTTSLIPASFGFGVGDFLKVIQLPIKICQALDESSGALKDSRDVKEELLCSGQTIEDFRSEIFRGSVILDEVLKG